MTNKAKMIWRGRIDSRYHFGEYRVLTTEFGAVRGPVVERLKSDALGGDRWEIVPRSNGDMENEIWNAAVAMALDVRSKEATP